MRTLNRKLLRNLWSLRGQGAAIAMVIATGVAMFVMSLVALDSLRLTQQAVYQQQRFADVFADLKRAPESLAERLSALPGVATLETRVRAPVKIEISDFPEPVTGHIISLPDGDQPQLNRLYFTEGSLPEAGRADQVVISEAFAEAHTLSPGDSLPVIINGRYQRLEIVGLALSPEFIYQIRPGDLFPDFQRYALLWMNRSAVAAAFGMEGAFNSVTLTLAPAYHPEPLIERLDLLLAPWGGLGAHDREQVVSHHYLQEELIQLETMAIWMPAIFLGVAAFLLNVVAGRLIRSQREQIAVLKAFGYSNLVVAAHYLALMLVLVFAGAGLGVLFGLWLAEAIAGIYQDFFRFPWLDVHLRPAVALLAVLVAGGATLIGTLGSVRSVFRLPPAEAMRPEPPARYRRTLLERLGIGWLSQPSRMILRNLERQPWKALFSVTGIALAVALIILTRFMEGAVGHMMAVQFNLAQKQDVSVSFNEPLSRRAVHDLAALPGVSHVEGFRVVPAVLRHGHLEYRTPLQGYPQQTRLSAILDQRLQAVALPAEGMMLTDHLARMLGVKPGDAVQVEVLEGRRPTLEVPVAGLVTEFIGVGAYLDKGYLSRLLGEGPAINGANLMVEQDQRAALNLTLAGLPAVAGVSLRESALNAFRELMDETMLTFTLFSLFIAGLLAFAVVYNNARIAFAERSRELASMRVLGFTRGEVTFVLLGELLLLTLLAMPFGFLLGTGLCWLLTLALQTDLYRIPLVLTPDTLALAAAVVLLATLLSSVLVMRRLARLDMVTALKSAE